MATPSPGRRGFRPSAWSVSKPLNVQEEKQHRPADRPRRCSAWKDAAEKAKIELSSKASTEKNLPFITADASGPKQLTIKITNAARKSWSTI